MSFYIASPSCTLASLALALSTWAAHGLRDQWRSIFPDGNRGTYGEAQEIADDTSPITASLELKQHQLKSSNALAVLLLGFCYPSLGLETTGNRLQLAASNVNSNHAISHPASLLSRAKSVMSERQRAFSSKSPPFVRTLADSAVDSAVIPVPVQLPTSSDSGGSSFERPLNLDFLPRLGWKGTVFPSVFSPMLCSVFSSAIVLWLWETQGFRGIDATGHTVLGVLVSFLTVFRTQQAYSRYWEGRGHLGIIMATTVDVASVASVHLDGSDPATLASAKEELARLLRMYFRETVVFLRKASFNTQRVSNYWLPADALASEEALMKECGIDETEEECEILAQVPRPPVLVLQWIRTHLFNVGVEKGLLPGSTAVERMQVLELGLHRTLDQLQPVFNGAAKIATTPAPQPYTQMSRWLVFSFVFSAPLALIKAFGNTQISESPPWILVPAAMLLAFGYYGLDYCSNQLQNPFIAEFGDVQLDGRFLQAVCTDVDVLLGTSQYSKGEA